MVQYALSIIHETFGDEVFEKVSTCWNSSE